jgi:hypothetical protein
MKTMKAWAIVLEGKLLEIRAWGDPEIYLTKAEAERQLRPIRETTIAGMRGQYDNIKIVPAEIRISRAR